MFAKLTGIGGGEIVGGPESRENGRFAWLVDPEGNKVELWEPMTWDDKNKRARDALPTPPDNRRQRTVCSAARR